MQDDHAESRERKPLVIVNEVPKFDLTSYIANYKGRTVFRRLYLIGSCSKVLGEEAARLAVIEAKKGSDVRNYVEAISLLKKVSRSGERDQMIDPTWAAQQEKKNAAETHRLENELKGYKNNLIKESIRMGNEDLGTHYYTIGDLRNAVKAYSRMRDYCTTPAHIASSAFRVMNVLIEQNKWLEVRSQVLKIRNLQIRPEEGQRHQSKTLAVSGLHLMAEGDYGEAAHSFLKTDPTLGEGYNEILTSNDVAVYGGLCALASMSRSELQIHVLDNANFRNFLELEPHIRRAVSFFCASKYSQCLDILESYRADYLLDIYLQPHVADIYHKIRTKSIVQYFQPFSKVTLTSMEKMFGIPRTPISGSNGSTATFLDELISLIETGELDARIDLETGVLVAKESDTRADALNDANKMITAFIREARLKLLRLNAVSAGLEVKAPNKKKAWDEDSPDGVTWQNGKPVANSGGKLTDLDAQQTGPVGPGGRNILTGNARGGGFSIRGNWQGK